VRSKPALQGDFTKRIFREAKGLGIHTCLDTSGLLGKNFSDEELQDIDLQLLDINSGDPEIYKAVTRQPLQPTIDYANRLSDLGRPMWVRYVLVPGLTDRVDNVEKVAQARHFLPARRHGAADARVDGARARTVQEPRA